MRMTRHNGRAGKNGMYNPKHNDRRFDIGNSEHIDLDRSKKNIYWDIFNGYRTFDHMEPELADTFEDVEQLYYEHYYCDFVEGPKAPVTLRFAKCVWKQLLFRDILRKTDSLKMRRRDKPVQAEERLRDLAGISPV